MLQNQCRRTPLRNTVLTYNLKYTEDVYFLNSYAWNYLKQKRFFFIIAWHQEIENCFVKERKLISWLQFSQTVRRFFFFFLISFICKNEELT